MDRLLLFKWFFEEKSTLGARRCHKVRAINMACPFGLVWTSLAFAMSKRLILLFWCGDANHTSCV